MSAALAMAPSPAPHDRPSFASDLPPPTAAASASASPSAQRMTNSASASAGPANTSAIQRPGSNSPRSGGASAAKSSPSGPSRGAAGHPKIVVKKEPGSPRMPNSRHRPAHLDLSQNLSKNASTPGSGRPLTAREGLGIQEVGIACLSPGFMTQDPVMKEQLRLSMSVREQQRHLIETRLHQQSAKGDGPSDKDKDRQAQFSAKTPGMSRRNKAPGLSIVAPSHEQFANERVIQSAPLGHSFTGRQHPAPLTRHVANQPSNLSSTSHIHHVPANQTNNRLPPISDVFGQNLTTHPEGANANASSTLYPNAHSARGPLTSPGHPPAPQPPTSQGRPRDYKSAEEAQQELAGGRPELLPKLVHYNGHHQPPTPPSPAPGSRPTDASRGTSKRRSRKEYEDGSSPPLGHGPAPTRRGPFGAGRDSPETQRQKKEEFLRLCDRAWDLFHS